MSFLIFIPCITIKEHTQFYVTKKSFRLVTLEKGNTSLYDQLDKPTAISSLHLEFDLMK